MKNLSIRSKATAAGVHLALSLQDIRHDDFSPSPETNDWHRREAERLADELNDEMLARDVRAALRQIRREERAERWERIIQRARRFLQGRNANRENV